MRLAIVVDGGVPQEAAGSVGRLLRYLVYHPLGKRLGQPASRALVGFALAWRSWEDELCEEGLVLNLTDGVLSLYVPGSVSGEVTNPVIAELLWRTGVLPKRKASLKSLDRMLEGVAPEGAVVESEGDSTAFRWRLEAPAAKAEEDSGQTPSGNRATARCTNPEPQSPRPNRVAARGRNEERGGSEVSTGETGRYTIGRPVEVPQEAVRPDVYRSADDRQAELLQVLCNHGRLSRRQLQEQLGWTRSTLRDVLRAAVEAGNVAKLAPHPRSPFQVYEVVERRPNHPRPPAGTRWRR